MVQWWALDPAKQIEMRLTRMANEVEYFEQNKIKTIQDINTGDHGQKKQRWGSKLVVRFDGLPTYSAISCLQKKK